MNDYENTNNCEGSENNEAVIEREGHRDRIRLRILSEGVDALPPVQMLEFLLYYVLPRQDVHEVAIAVMNHFGDIRRVFHSGLEDFRQVKILGENGAQWLSMISRCMSRFARLDPSCLITVDNRRELLDLACRLRPLFPAPFCMQVLTDANDLLVMRSPLASTLEWMRQDVLHAALKDASCAAARNAYMIIFTGNHALHPNRYDMESVYKYALLLKHCDCMLRDVMFVSRDGYTSMYNLNMIPEIRNVTGSYAYLPEDVLEDLPERSLKIRTLSTDQIPMEDL